MSDTDHPAPPPVSVSLAALLGNLQQLSQPQPSPGEQDADDPSTAGLGEDTHAQALANLRAVATACGIDWEDVQAEHARRSVVAE